MANTQKHILLYVLGSYRYVTNQHTQQLTTTHVHQLRASGGQESGRGSLAAVSHQARVKVLAKAVGSLEADWSSPHTPLVVGRIDLFLALFLISKPSVSCWKMLSANRGCSWFSATWACPPWPFTGAFFKTREEESRMSASKPGFYGIW